MDKNVRAYVAELVGTFALVFIGAGTICVDSLCRLTPSATAPAPGLVGIVLAEALALAAGLAATIYLSGGYLNPAVTVALWACKRLDGARTTALVFVQLLGAAIAGGLVRAIFNSSEIALVNARMGTPHLNADVFSNLIDFSTRIKGIGIEAILTFIVTIIIFATTIDPRHPKLLGRVGKWLSGLWVGVALAAVMLVGYSLTGAATNPARWFGTVIWEASYSTRSPLSEWPIYVIGPILGAVLAAGVYVLLVLPMEEERHAPTTASTGVGHKVGAGAASTLFRARK